jgi:hypothetical protein
LAIAARGIFRQSRNVGHRKAGVDGDVSLRSENACDSICLWKASENACGGLCLWQASENKIDIYDFLEGCKNENGDDAYEEIDCERESGNDDDACGEIDCASGSDESYWGQPVRLLEYHSRDATYEDCYESANDDCDPQYQSARI